MDLSRDDAVALLAFMMAGSDGDVGADEERTITAGLAARNIRLTPEALGLIRGEAARTRDGSQTAWRRIRKALGNDHAREEAFELAIDVVLADHALDPNEMTEVQEMADHLDISRAAMSRHLSKFA